MSMLMRQFLTFSAVMAGGVLIGAGLGLLYAPQSGRVTRGQIQVYAHRAQDEMTHMGGRVSQTMNGLVEKGRMVFSK